MMTPGSIRLALALGAALLPGNAVTAEPVAKEMAAPEDDVWSRHAVPDGTVAREGRKALPFTREQIEMLARLLRQTQSATARAGAGIVPEGQIRRVSLPQGGDGRAPVIRLRRGYTTVLSFTDLTGAPWPIEEVLMDRAFVPASPDGNGPEAEVSREDQGARHLLYLVPQRDWMTGNAVVKLQVLADPLVLILTDDGGKHVDFRVDLRLKLPGPNVDAAVLVRAGGIHAGDRDLLDLLTGTVPVRAIRLAVEGGGPEDRAWRVGTDLLLVTRSDLLSPGPWAAERGSAGRWAYRLPDTPYALVSADGVPRRLAFRIPPSDLKEAPNDG